MTLTMGLHTRRSTPALPRASLSVATSDVSTLLAAEEDALPPAVDWR